MLSDAMSRDTDKICFNCEDPLEDCNCGNTETWEDKEGPICPFCGYLNKACDSGGLLYSESTDEYDCGDCGKTFSVSVGITFLWIASRTEQ